MVKPHRFNVGDTIRVVGIPPGLHDAAEIGTPEVFRDAVGKTFRVEGFDEHGNLELEVWRTDLSNTQSVPDTIWIEPEFVEPVEDATPTT
jgi:hypothetical protein